MFVTQLYYNVSVEWYTTKFKCDSNVQNHQFWFKANIQLIRFDNRPLYGCKTVRKKLWRCKMECQMLCCVYDNAWCTSKFKRYMLRLIYVTIRPAFSRKLHEKRGTFCLPTSFSPFSMFKWTNGLGLRSSLVFFNTSKSNVFWCKVPTSKIVYIFRKL